jgi:hypothetical protein
MIRQGDTIETNFIFESNFIFFESSVISLLLLS